MTAISLLSDADMARVTKRISHEIIERNNGAKNIVLVGVLRRGALFANRLKKAIKSIEGISVPVYSLDITDARDDVTLEETRNHLLNENISGVELVEEIKREIYPPEISSVSNIDLENFNVVIVDDVLFTGRTIRACMQIISGISRPKTIQLAVMIDRGHRELPIKADYVGKNIQTNRMERVNMKMTELDDVDLVELVKPNLG
jgi:pyrimidine operon attenuation protein/uracil phosphoribosyltransferase